MRDYYSEDYAMFVKFFGHEPKKLMKAPYRKDNNKSLSVYTKNGKLMWKDHATGDGGFIPSLIEKCFGIKPNPDKEVVKIIPKNTSAEIKIYTTDWTEHDLLFWKQFHITYETILKYPIDSLEKFWCDNGKRKYFVDKKNYMFSYSFGDKFKIYMPGQTPKFHGNSNMTSIMGLSYIDVSDKVLVLTKSFKEILLFREFGINSIAPNSESISPESIESTINYFADSGFKIYLNSDFDNAGLVMADKYMKYYGNKIYGLIFTYDTNLKDPSDYTKARGFNSGYNLIKKQL